ncbi:XrtA/PEP-CTERM system amidotransferase [Lacisediminimonas profundi]|uniref:XrtA/PEP-CTERM system amidotransferase n=1 Tax=Lacisediminimonas profundi TaxID=2603856 RepID=UPI00124B590C|nr:XrtA/PEP-CTERM system amidotransferase [Lacisediminimonas profundi]
MCGITGLFDTTGWRRFERGLVHAMNESQHHRGPDQGALHLEPGVALGHRRLSIIDLEGGQQPLFSADGSVAIVFNGEIYNFRALTAELRKLGHEFLTHSDTEVIVHAWQAWGEDCVRRLQGMFTFAIWDRQRQSLFLARDRIGIKPLFHALLPDGTFAFGSELKTLLALPQLDRSLEPQAVEAYFGYGYIPDPLTIFAHVRKLPPGHTLAVGRRCGPPVERQYWDLSFRPGPEKAANIADEAFELRERLRVAVQSHLMADVPLGAFLSGGVDSSAVVATMAGLQQSPVLTSNIAFDRPEFDESGYAQAVASRYGTDHQSELVRSDDFGLVDLLAWLYDEPFADSSAIPTYRVCQLAARRVKVALSGDGGDENFAGYRRYRHAVAEDRLRQLLPPALRRPLFGALGRWYPKADWAPRVLRARSTFESLARDLPDGYFHGVSLMTDRQRAQLFSPAFKRQLQGFQASDMMRAHARNAPDGDALATIQYLDFKTWLPGDILTKVDRASMAHGLEVRVPLLDHQFVEWAATLPSSLKLRGGEGKYLLKKAMEPSLPHALLYRSKKGFSVPLAVWLRGPLRQPMQAALLGPRLGATGYFDMQCIASLVSQHLSGASDHSAALWALLMFEAFLRKTDAASGQAYAGLAQRMAISTT